MLARRSAGPRRLHRLLGLVGLGALPSVLQRAAGFRTHVLHGGSPDARRARRRHPQPRERDRLLYGGDFRRTGTGPSGGRLARRIGGAGAHPGAVRHRARRRGCQRRDRAADQAAREACAEFRPGAAHSGRGAAANARLSGAHGRECGDRDRARSPGDLSALIPVAALLRMRGFPVLMAASVVTVTALDLLVIYLPVLGTEREIDSDHIGLLLTLRSVASLISRVFYTRLIFAVGRLPLTLASMLASAVTFLILAIPLALPTMYAVLIALGFAMGIASTLTISSVVHLAPPDACGTALTLRMTGNRIGQIVFPALAGLLAAATGVAGVLLALGAGLAASGMAVALRKPSGKGG